MKLLPRILMALAALGLLTLFLFPMWQITLFAPQYPNGVTMYIHINKISGDTPGTLQNINILNHYIGMKKIVPESIPELTILPFVVVVLISLGLLAAIVNDHRVYLGWALLFGLLCLIGIYDFYLWEYDYGHNLDPNAPMKFPGASFQPPLIGTKEIINFTAVSLPHTSGFIAMGSMVLSFLAWWIKLKIVKKNNHEKNSSLPNPSLVLK